MEYTNSNKENAEKLNIECRNCYTQIEIEKKDGIYKCYNCGYKEEINILDKQICVLGG